MPQVSIDYAKSHDALRWAKEHCPNYITNQVDVIHLAENENINTIKLIFYFAHENDASLFALRWA